MVLRPAAATEIAAQIAAHKAAWFRACFVANENLPEPLAVNFGVWDTTC